MSISTNFENPMDIMTGAYTSWDLAAAIAKDISGETRTITVALGDQPKYKRSEKLVIRVYTNCMGKSAAVYKTRQGHELTLGVFEWNFFDKYEDSVEAAEEAYLGWLENLETIAYDLV